MSAQELTLGAGGNKVVSPLPAFAGTGNGMRGQDFGFGFARGRPSIMRGLESGRWERDKLRVIVHEPCLVSGVKQAWMSGNIGTIFPKVGELA